MYQKRWKNKQCFSSSLSDKANRQLKNKNRKIRLKKEYIVELCNTRTGVFQIKLEQKNGLFSFISHYKIHIEC